MNTISSVAIMENLLFSNKIYNYHLDKFSDITFMKEKFFNIYYDILLIKVYYTLIPLC